MQNNRLDFIKNIDEEAINAMKRARELYIELDNFLQDLEDMPEYSSSGAARTVSIARTNLEISLQFAIKSLCLVGEIK